MGDFLRYGMRAPVLNEHLTWMDVFKGVVLVATLGIIGIGVSLFRREGPEDPVATDDVGDEGDWE